MIIPVTINGSTFTATERFPFAENQSVVVESRIPNQVPAPLVEFDSQGSRVLYYLKNVTGSSFQLSATSGGAPVTLTDSGIGQITVSEFPPLNWEQLLSLPLLTVSTFRDQYTSPESIINLSAASDQAIGVSRALNVFTSGIPHGFLNWQAVRFSSSGTLPAPLQANTTYYAITNSNSDSTFSVTSVVGGSALTITSAGTGQVGVQNYALNEVIEKKIKIGMRWMYDALLLKVSNHMKFVSRSWWWWFTPPTAPTDVMFYPSQVRSQIVLDNLRNPEKLIDALIDFTAWAMISDGKWRNLVKDPTFFQEFNRDTVADAERAAKRRLDTQASLLLVSGYQGASKVFDFEQTTDTINISLV